MKIDKEMNRKQAYILPIIMATVLFLFSSCKDDGLEFDNSGSTSNADVFRLEEAVAGAENMISDVIHLVQLGIDDESVFSSSEWPIIQKESSGYPLRLSLDFGSDTSENFDYRYRSGKIIANISSHWKDSLSIMTIELDDYYVATKTPYYVDGVKKYYVAELGGEMEIRVENKGLTTVDNERFKTQHIIIDSGKAYNSRGSIGFRTSRETYYIQGYDSPEHDDDNTRNVIHSDGYAFDDKHSYTWSSRNPSFQDEGLPYFGYNRSCPWAISGDIRLDYENNTNQQKRKSLINFGPANQTSCENNASYSVGGIIIAITLP